MHRPRRTSEFLDDTSRNSAQKLRSTLRVQSTPSTAQKYSQRRTAIATRNSSCERSNAGRGATPLPVKSISRKLFPGSATGGVALHNDKKFIQEQTQRITEHLRKAVLAGYSNLEFINHTALRQMSIKQFVAIINYLLHFIAGSRLSIGTNHVDDIVKALQSLQYPYAINRSWLKTPNTQHSYGNVVVLLSWLLDFAPALDEDEDWSFPLQAPCAEQSLGNDVEFQREMMLHCEQAFTLWDKQLMTEYANMQQTTCDLYIKTCGLEDMTHLEQAIKKLRHELEKLQPKCTPEIQAMQRQLLQESEKLRQQKQTLKKELQFMSGNKHKLQQQLQFNSQQVMQLEQDVLQLQQQVKQQVISVQQRDILIQELDQHKHVAKAQQRTLGELREKNDRQQIELSRLKKQLTDHIEKFNLRMRQLNEIVLANRAAFQLAFANGQMQLPLNLKQEDLEYAGQQLTALNEQIDKQMLLMEQEISKATLSIEQSENHIKYNLMPAFEDVVNKLKQTELAMQKQEAQEKILAESVQRRQQLNAEIGKHELSLMEITIEMDKQRELKVNVEQQNEMMFNEAEQQHKARVIAEQSFLNKLEEQVDTNMSELIKLEELINECIN